MQRLSFYSSRSRCVLPQCLCVATASVWWGRHRLLLRCPLGGGWGGWRWPPPPRRGAWYPQHSRHCGPPWTCQQSPSVPPRDLSRTKPATDRARSILCSSGLAVSRLLEPVEGLGLCLWLQLGGCIPICCWLDGLSKDDCCRSSERCCRWWGGRGVSQYFWKCDLIIDGWMSAPSSQKKKKMHLNAHLTEPHHINITNPLGEKIRTNVILFMSDWLLCRYILTIFHYSHNSWAVSSTQWPYPVWMVEHFLDFLVSKSGSGPCLIEVNSQSS